MYMLCQDPALDHSLMSQLHVYDVAKALIVYGVHDFEHLYTYYHFYIYKELSIISENLNNGSA